MTSTDCEHQHIRLQQQRCVSDALPVSVCRSEEGQAESNGIEGEDLGSILAEGVAKALLHTHLWSAVPDRCLQVSHAEALTVKHHFMGTMEFADKRCMHSSGHSVDLVHIVA